MYTREQLLQMHASGRVFRKGTTKHFSRGISAPRLL